MTQNHSRLVPYQALSRGLRSTKLAAAAALLCAAIGSLESRAAAQQAPQPCLAPEFRQMDFWLGNWTVEWDAAPGVPSGSGTNRITREYGGCVIVEAFDGGAASGNLIGHSVSTYQAPLQRWRQTWVDNQGGYFAFIGGREGDRFILVTTRPGDSVPVQRMVFEDISADRLTWRWQRTPDGGTTWSDQWVIRYRRTAA